MSLSTIIKSVQDIMRQDAGVDGDAQRISQLVWMIFLKIFDDKEMEYELMDDNYTSPVPEELRWRNWAADDEGMTGDELLDFINDALFKTLKELSVGPDVDPRGRMVREVFADTYNYMKSGTLIRQVINKINQIDFNSIQDRHVFNEIYEQILRNLQSAGNAGEYYTPRPVTNFMVDMVNPQLGETVLDPACGTGGFLVGALENMRKQSKTSEDWQTLQKSIMGIEKKPLPHMLSMTNLILHDIEVPDVRRDNSLSRQPYRSYTDKERVDCILTNPPFGGMEEPGVEKSFPKVFQTKETADLFLVLIMQLLKDGGRATIVLPDGFLFGEGVKTRIKERLMERCNLHTIVRLPNNVFAPYTGIKTNLLFFTKGEPTEEVWYFEHPMPEDRKHYSKTRPIDIKEFELEKSWWYNREESEYAWKVLIDEIKQRNYNLDINNPHTSETGYGDPIELLAAYQRRLNEIAEKRNQLKNELESSMNDDEFRESWNFLFDNFDLLYSDVQNIEQLRQVILQLAVKGRLVPQAPADEPATELIKRIKYEKAFLISKKKIKKTKPLPAISPDEIPYELPEGWAWVRLAEIGQINPRNDVDDDLIVSFSPMKMVPIKYNESIKYEERVWDDIKRGFTHFADNDVLLAKITPCFENGKSVVAKNLKNSLGAGTTELHIFRGNPECIVPEYVLVYFKSPQFLKEGEEKMTGTAGQKRLPRDYVSLNPFPLPPFNEQKRIVAKVDKLMKLCDELESQLAQSKQENEQLMQAVLQEAFRVKVDK